MAKILMIILFAVAVAGGALTGCDNDKKKKGAADATSSTGGQSSAEPQAKGGSGFDEMAASVMQQAAAQGLQLDASGKEALALVIRIYLTRGELHQIFGNPEKFNLTALIQWAAQYGTTVDHAKPKLAPHASVLNAMSAKTNPEKPVFVRVE